MRENTLELRPEFAEVLRIAIRRRGLTYRKAAVILNSYLPREVHVSDFSLWTYAKGRARPRRIDVVKAISEAFEIDIEELIVMQDGPENQASHISVKDRGNGTVLVSVKMTVPTEVAERICSLFAEASRTASSESVSTLRPENERMAMPPSSENADF